MQKEDRQCFIAIFGIQKHKQTFNKFNLAYARASAINFFNATYSKRLNKILLEGFGLYFPNYTPYLYIQYKVQEYIINTMQVSKLHWRYRREIKTNKNVFRGGTTIKDCRRVRHEIKY